MLTKARRGLCGRCSCIAVLGALFFAETWGAESGADGKDAPRDAEASLADVIEAAEANSAVLVLYLSNIGDTDMHQKLPLWDVVTRKLRAPPEASTAAAPASSRLRGAKARRELGPLQIMWLRMHPFQAAQQFGITELPGVLLLRQGGDMARYSGDFESQAIVNWVNFGLNRTQPLRRGEDLDRFVHDSGLAVIGLYESDESSEEASALAAVARSTNMLERNVAFAAGHGRQLAAELAGKLTRYMRQQCTAVTVGPGRSQQTTLPQKDASAEGAWQCSTALLDPLADGSKAEAAPFRAEVVDGHLAIVRTDGEADEGRKRHLHLKCCIDRPNPAGVPAGSKVPSVTLLSPHGAKVYDGDLGDESSLGEWLEDEMGKVYGQMVVELTPATFDVVFGKAFQLSTTPVLMVALKDSPDTDEVRSQLDLAAVQLDGKVIPSLLPASSPLQLRMVKQFGLPPENEDSVDEDSARVKSGVYILARSNNGFKKYSLSGESGSLKSSSIVRFVEDFSSSKLTALLKSEPEPEDLFTGSVRNLVGTTFQGVAKNKSLDVLVLFYAPWCGYCAKIKPIYMQLGKRLGHVETLVVAQIDATRNEAEDQEINGYPTIILFPAGDSKERVEFFEGDRTVDTMIGWLHHRCTHEFNDTAPGQSSQETSGLLDGDEDDL